jgi:hypothetical protein
MVISLFPGVRIQARRFGLAASVDALDVPSADAPDMLSADTPDMLSADTPDVPSVMRPDVGSGCMTAVIDISCPSCGRTDAVRKRGLGTYRCAECGEEFDQSAIEP